MASHRRFEEQPLRPMTAKIHTSGADYSLYLGAAETKSLGHSNTFKKLVRVRDRLVLRCFTVVTERRKQEPTECKTNTKLALFWHFPPGGRLALLLLPPPPN